MDFDIHQLDHVDPESAGSEAAFEAFQEALLDRFAESPEGQARLKADPHMGFWAAQLIYYGYQYEGAAVPQMKVGDVRTVVTDLFPGKISLASPEEADHAIPELVAFWQYLKREFRLPKADAVLGFLHDVEPEFPEMMNDPSNFGMGKSFFMMGRAAGFDMTTREGMEAFTHTYNAGLLARQTPSPLPLILSSFDQSFRLDPAHRKAKKKKRKTTEQARKRNRKRRK